MTRGRFVDGHGRLAKQVTGGLTATGCQDQAGDENREGRHQACSSGHSEGIHKDSERSPGLCSVDLHDHSDQLRNCSNV